MSFVRRTHFYHKLGNISTRSIKPEFQVLFEQLRELILPYRKKLVLKHNATVRYELWTNHRFEANNLQYRGKVLGRQIKSRIGMQFAAVVIYKDWVSFYLHPLNLNKQLQEEVSENLRLLFPRNSKSTFHFTTLTEELKADLTHLISRCWDFYVEQGWVNPLD